MLQSPAAIVAAAMPVHLYLAASTELSPDEAYYLVGGRLGPIPDHPPLTSWLAGVVGPVRGLPVELQVRLPAVALSAVLVLGLVCLARHEARRSCASESGVEHAARTAALLGTWLPLPAAGGFVLTPDVAAGIGWLAALGWGSGAVSRGWWGEIFVLGALAFGSLAKVSVLPAVLIGVLAQVLSQRREPSLGAAGRAPHPSARAGLTSILYLLFLALTWKHLMPSMSFQWHHAFGFGAPDDIAARAGLRMSLAEPISALGAVVASVGSLLALFSPPVVWLGLVTIPSLSHVYGLTAGAFATLLLGSAIMRGLPVEPNWWLPAALPILVSASVAVGRRRMRRTALIGLVAAIVMPTALALAHAAHPFLPIATRLDPTARLHGWRSGTAPSDAPGVGPYGAAAERCVYQNTCDEILSYFISLQCNLQK